MHAKHKRLGHKHGHHHHHHKQNDYDPLEHTRYGEAKDGPTTHQLPIPNPLVKPLTITNGVDRHDIKMPYKNSYDIRKREEEERKSDEAAEAKRKADAAMVVAKKASSNPVMSKKSSAGPIEMKIKEKTKQSGAGKLGLKTADDFN